MKSKASLVLLFLHRETTSNQEKEALLYRWVFFTTETRKTQSLELHDCTGSIFVLS